MLDDLKKSFNFVVCKILHPNDHCVVGENKLASTFREKGEADDCYECYFDWFINDLGCLIR